jgi:hypothetical protein
MRRLLIMAASVAIAFSADAQEATQRGNDMVEACRIVASGNPPTADTAFQAGICLGEIEALNWIAPGLEGDVIRACVPPDVTRQQLAIVVANYLEHNADRLREPFQGLALEALAGTWPCQIKPGWLVKLWNRLVPTD